MSARPPNREPLSAQERFAEVLSELPAVERSALALSEIGGLPDDEIAERLGTSVHVVESVLVRARSTARAKLHERRGGIAALVAQLAGWLAAAPAARAAGVVAAAVVGTTAVVTTIGPAAAERTAVPATTIGLLQKRPAVVAPPTLQPRSPAHVTLSTSRVGVASPRRAPRPRTTASTAAPAPRVVRPAKPRARRPERPARRPTVVPVRPAPRGPERASPRPTVATAAAPGRPPAPPRVPPAALRELLLPPLDR